MIVTWNLTSYAREYRRADVLVFSVAKSGRTWLRVLLNKYLSLIYGVPFDVGDLHEKNPDAPSVFYDHEMWRHFCDATVLDRVLGRNIAPSAVTRDKKVVLVYRDPRDVAVSLYFQKTRRSRDRLDVDISRFIRDRRYGIRNIVRVMNLWHERFGDATCAVWMRYEAMKADTPGELRRLLKFLGVEVRDDLAAQAVEFASFDNMKQMEANDAFGRGILRARDPSDPNSFKVREGKVGGYVKHFSDEADLRYLNDAVRALHPFFNYTPENL